MAPVIRGNSLYTIVDGPSWTQAEANAAKLGGHLGLLEDNTENQYIYDLYKEAVLSLWIGLTDMDEEGQWLLSDGRSASYFNWAEGEPNNYGESVDGLLIPDEDYVHTKLFDQGKWNDLFEGYEPLSQYNTSYGIAEIPLTASITFSAAPKQGAGVFTTSINLSAGTSESGNLAEGATVFWKVTGIDADDLASGELSGAGEIVDGELDLRHALKRDSDTNESFEISVFSDAGMTQQIGSSVNGAVLEGPKVIGHGNSIYVVIDGPSWTEAEANSVKLGGHLASIVSSEENDFVWSFMLAQPSQKHTWIGGKDETGNGEWGWSDETN